MCNGFILFNGNKLMNKDKADSGLGAVEGLANDVGGRAYYWIDKGGQQCLDTVCIYEDLFNSFQILVIISQLKFLTTVLLNFCLRIMICLNMLGNYKIFDSINHFIIIHLSIRVAGFSYEWIHCR